MKRFVCSLACGLLGVALLATPALAHAAYKSSTPADKATVSSAPSSVTAEFTEPLSDESYLRVYDACGAEVSGETNINGYEMTVPMSSSNAGTFTVEFFALSVLDGHPTKGDFTFTASDGASCAGTGGSSGSSQGSSGAPRSSRGGGGASSASSSAPGDPTTAGASDAGANSSRSSAGAGKHAQHPRRKGDASLKVDRRGRAATARANAPKVVTLAQEERADPGLGTFPVGGLLLALGMSAAIGLLGGQIYLGLMGGRE